MEKLNLRSHPLPRPRTSFVDDHDPENSELPPRRWFEGDFVFCRTEEGHEAYAKVISCHYFSEDQHRFRFDATLRWQYCVEICHVLHQGKTSVELDVDRQEWLCEGVKIQPHIRPGLVKVVFCRNLHDTALSAGESVRVLLPPGERIRCHIRRATWPRPVHDGIEFSAMYEVVDPEVKVYRVTEQAIVGRGE